MLLVARVIVACLIFFGLAAFSRSALETVPAPSTQSAPWAQCLNPLIDTLALWQPSFVADWLFLAAVAQFGQRSTDAVDYVTLAPLLTRCSHIDPKFDAPYILAGTALNLHGMDRPAGRALLARGAQALPEDWHIKFLWAMQTYLDAPGDRDAAVAMAEAAKITGAPAHLGPLAARMAAQAHDPDLGLDLLDVLSAQTQDPSLRAAYTERRRLLLLERVLGQVQAAADAYGRRYSAPPPSLTALVQAGLMAEVPEDPLGGALGVSRDGRVITAHEALRLSHMAGAHAAPPKDPE